MARSVPARRAPISAALAGLTAGLLATAAVPRPAAAAAVLGDRTAAGAAEPSAAAPEGLEPPELLTPLTIPYPAALASAADPPQGVVTVRFVIGVDGQPIEFELVQGVHPEIDAAVRAAVLALRYRPARYRGRAVEIATGLELTIAPPAAPPPAEPAASPEPVAADSEASPQGATEDVAAATATLEGRLTSAGTRAPLACARVFVAPAPEGAPEGRVRTVTLRELPPAWTIELTTDREGRFVGAAIPAGAIEVVIDAEGHERAAWIERLAPGEVLEVRYFAEPRAVDPFRTVVRTRRSEREEVSRRSLSVAEVNAMPGTQGDALRALTNLPGVARAPLGVGLIAIRGASPFDSAIYVGDHTIPVLFHFGALATAVSTDALAGVSFIPSNYDARYGNALGGVIAVEPRAGRRDRVHGSADVDIIDAGVLVEGPVGRGSYLLAARRSLIDAVLPAVLPGDAGLQFTRAPRYYDYQAFFDYPVGAGDVSVRVFGGDDRFVLVQAAENDDEVDDRNRSASVAYFHRADVTYAVERDGWRLRFGPSYRYEFASGNQGDVFDFDVGRHGLSVRGEVERRIARRASVEVGTETNVTFYSLQGLAPAVPDAQDSGSAASPQLTRATGVNGYVGAYASATLGLGTPLRVIPGVRIAQFVDPLDELAVDPRVRFVWDVASRTAIRGGVGQYSQTPLLPQLDATFGNPRVNVQKALHTSVEVEQRVGEGLSLVAAGFYKWQWALAVPSRELGNRPDGRAAAENAASTGVGRIYGLELLVRQDLTRALVGWVSYTLMRSERRDTAAGPWYPFDFDQRHILTLLGGVLLPERWRLSTRLRIVSGNPTTRVRGAVYDGSSGDYLPLDGARNGTRLPTFVQWDVRVDKQWLWRWGGLSAYLDVQNVTNRPNPEFDVYGFDYRERTTVNGLPILPGLGLKLEW
jgi:hypothetical protein